VKVALAAVLAVLVFSSSAAAHVYNKPVPLYQERVELRMANWRVQHGETWTPWAGNVRLMSLALAIYDFEKRRLRGFRIEGEPFSVWSLLFVGPAFDAGILKTYRCFGRVFTPNQAIRTLARDAKAKSIMLDPAYKIMGASVRYMHAHGGYFKKKGRCTVYYIGFAG
jgi:hypothetical protein